MTTDPINVLTHSSIRIADQYIIYVDPFRVDQAVNDADIILITHDHFDHFSEEDIAKVVKEDTILVVPEKMKKQASAIRIPNGNLLTVAQKDAIEVHGLRIETVPAYNLVKPFHPRKAGWVGYILYLDAGKVYIAGDTDLTDENQNVTCDIALVPIGGTFTMNAKKAAELINSIRPKVAIPVHYGSVIGSKSDEEEFLANVDDGIKVEIKMQKL